MDDQLKNFRQPMVISAVVILGFVLNFSSNFVQTDTHNDYVAYIVGLCLLVGVICLILVLSRILRMQYPQEQAIAYYKRALRLFIFGVSLSFKGVFVKMTQHFFTDDISIESLNET